jgi:hypothetical protein
MVHTPVGIVGFKLAQVTVIADVISPANPKALCHSALVGGELRLVKSSPATSVALKPRSFLQ